MKISPLTLVGAFLFVLAIFLAWNKEKPETTNTNTNPRTGLIETVQEAPKKKEQEKYKVSVQLNPVFSDSE